ncbi:MAG: STAS/SEC14 domain-containing protein [Bacteroidota bacterium]|nr:STAS/SEC14 domain-containing protein [Bacteroidota bacterium]
MLKIPGNVQVQEWPTSTSWIDEDGILYSISKKGVEPPSLEETKKLLEQFKEMIGGKKICMLIDVTHTTESTRETRDYVAEEFPKYVKAIAMVSDSALGKMLANLFFTLKTQPYPTKMFSNEIDAKAWLKQYL